MFLGLDYSNRVFMAWEDSQTTIFTLDIMFVKLGTVMCKFGNNSLKGAYNNSTNEKTKQTLTKPKPCATIIKPLRHPYRGVEQLEARRAHNPEVVGSSPASATIKSHEITRFQDFFLLFRGRKVRRKILQIRRKPFDPYSDP